MVRERSSPLPEQVLARQQNREEKDIIEDPPVKLFLSTGCTLLNCALSNRHDGGWPSGRISNMVGETDTAKSLIGWQTLAEACRNPNFDDYRLIFIDKESASIASRSSISRMFGKSLAERIELLTPSDENSQPPETVEQFHYYLLDLFDSNRPFVCILDSLDHLPSEAELQKTEENKEAHDKGKESKGSYQMSKQKYLKKMFGELSCQIMKTESILIPISQTIANIGSMFNPRTRAGGSGLDFSSRIIFWLTHQESDKVKDRVIGRKLKCKVTKNHVTYDKRDVSFWVYDKLGVDDIKSNIEFLTKEQIWPKTGGWIIPEGMSEDKFQMKQLIKHIEDNNLENELAMLIGKTWEEIEKSITPNRKKKYE